MKESDRYCLVSRCEFWKCLPNRPKGDIEGTCQSEVKTAFEWNCPMERGGLKLILITADTEESR
jgi:hypothetical protein